MALLCSMVLETTGLLKELLLFRRNAPAHTHFHLITSHAKKRKIKNGRRAEKRKFNNLFLLLPLFGQ